MILFYWKMCKGTYKYKLTKRDENTLARALEIGSCNSVYYASKNYDIPRNTSRRRKKDTK